MAHGNEGGPDVRIAGEAIVGEIEVMASPARVFRALTDPERLKAWWGSKESYWVEEWRSDLRIGGSWEAHCNSAAGIPSRVHGVFLELDPPRRLAYTWNPSWHPGPETTVVYDLVPRGKGTLVRVKHSGFGTPAAREDHLGGWPSVLRWLRAHVEKPEDGD